MWSALCNVIYSVFTTGSISCPYAGVRLIFFPSGWKCIRGSDEFWWFSLNVHTHRWILIIKSGSVFKDTIYRHSVFINMHQFLFFNLCIFRLSFSDIIKSLVLRYTKSLQILTVVQQGFEKRDTGKKCHPVRLSQNQEES